MLKEKLELSLISLIDEIIGNKKYMHDADLKRRGFTISLRLQVGLSRFEYRGSDVKAGLHVIDFEIPEKNEKLMVVIC